MYEGCGNHGEDFDDGMLTQPSKQSIFYSKDIVHILFKFLNGVDIVHMEEAFPIMMKRIWLQSINFFHYRLSTNIYPSAMQLEMEKIWFEDLIESKQWIIYIDLTKKEKTANRLEVTFASKKYRSIKHLKGLCDRESIILNKVHEISRLFEQQFFRASCTYRHDIEVSF